jgi:hypothetical protein
MNGAVEIEGQIDSVWIPALEAFAKTRHMTIEQAVGVLVRQGLQQRAPGELIPGAKKTCAVCDTEFELIPGRGSVQQLYCNVKCKKYVTNYGSVARAREMFAATQRLKRFR